MFKLSDPDRGLLEQTYVLRFRLKFGSLFITQKRGHTEKGHRKGDIVLYFPFTGRPRRNKSYPPQLLCCV